MKTVSKGDHVIFTDSRSRKCHALVTCVFGDVHCDEQGNVTSAPAINVVFVSNDNDREDSYGRQIERQTSAVHVASQPAHGNYWDWPE